MDSRYFLLFTMLGLSMLYAGEAAPPQPRSTETWSPEIILKDYQFSSLQRTAWKIEYGKKNVESTKRLKITFQVFSPNKALILTDALGSKVVGSTFRKIIDGTGKNLLTEKTVCSFQFDRNRPVVDGVSHIGEFSIEGLLEPSTDGRSISLIDGELSVCALEEHEVGDIDVKLAAASLNQSFSIADQLTLTVTSLNKNDVSFRMTPTFIDYERFLKFSLVDSSGSKLADLRSGSIVIKDSALEFVVPLKIAVPAETSLRIVHPTKFIRLNIPMHFIAPGKLSSPETQQNAKPAVSIAPMPLRETKNYGFVPAGCTIERKWTSDYKDNLWLNKTSEDAEAIMVVAAKTRESFYFSGDDGSRDEDVVDLQVVDDKGRNLLLYSTDFGYRSPRVRLFTTGRKYIAEFRVPFRVPAADAESLTIRGQISLLGAPGTKQVEFPIADVCLGAKLKLSENCFLSITEKKEAFFRYISDLKPAQNGLMELYDEKGKRVNTGMMNGKNFFTCPPTATKLRVLFQTQNVGFSVTGIKLSGATEQKNIK